MKRTFRVILIVVPLCLCMEFSAEARSWLWVTHVTGPVSEEGRDIAIDSGSNCYVTGDFEDTIGFGNITLTSLGSKDIFVAKLDSLGNVLWAKQAGGSASDTGERLVVDSSGNCYIVGSFQKTAKFGSISIPGTNSYESYAFVAKLDALGKWLWVKSITGGSFSRVDNIAVDRDGNCHVLGSFSGAAIMGSTKLNSVGDSSIFFAKLDTSGNWLWAVQAGGLGYIEGSSIALDNEGNSYIAGHFHETTKLGQTNLVSGGEMDCFVARLDVNGNWLWAKRAGGTSYDIAENIVVDNSGNILLSGSFQGVSIFGSVSLTCLSEPGYPDNFVAILDASGNWIGASKSKRVKDKWYTGKADDSFGNSYLTGQFSGVAKFGDITLNSGSIYNQDLFIGRVSVSDSGFIQAVENHNSFYSALSESNYVACDSLISNGFRIEDYFDNFNEHLLESIQCFHEGLDDMFYYGNFTEREEKEYLYKAEQDLINTIGMFKHYNLRITIKSKMLQEAKGNNLLRVFKAISEY